MKMTRRVAEPIVSIIDLGEAHGLGDGVRQLLSMIPMDRIIRPADTVVIDPNFVSAKGIAASGLTNPDVLRAVIRAIKRFSPKRLVVAEGSGGTETEKMLALVGADRVIREERVEFVDLNDPPLVEMPIQHDRPNRVAVNRIVHDLDVLVSLSTLKMHEEATITAAMKNVALSFPAGAVYGLPKADVSGLPNPLRNDLHADLHGFIVAMNKLLPIDLAILEADEVMIGTGPTRGKPMRAGMLLAGTDPVALDVVGAHLLGFKPQAVRYLWQALSDGLGEGALERIDFRGLEFEAAARVFSKRVYGKEIVVW